MLWISDSLIALQSEVFESDDACCFDCFRNDSHSVPCCAEVVAISATVCAMTQPERAIVVTSEPCRFRARDGFELSGCWYQCASSQSMAVLIASATGVRQRFYSAFAHWLAEQGRTVLTFDYRGIGDSLGVKHVRNSRARKQDWGQLDMPAALDYLLDRAGASQADLIGHSAGAQLVGLMPNHGKLRRVAAVSASTGYIGAIRGPLRIFARVFMSGYIPLTNRLLGYAPARIIGWGEDLPAGVARQWAEWCSRPGYVANSFGGEIASNHYDEFAAPIQVFHASDDAIATPANVRDLLRLFPAAPVQTRELRPSDFNVPHIGHIDMFRRSHAAVWPVLAAAIA
jgi:predicted alpha/beta hydrolase